MSDTYGDGLAVNIAESTSAPGEGRLIATAFASTAADTVSTDLVYTTDVVVSRATLRRFPDLVNLKRDTFGVPARRRSRSDEVVRDTLARIEEHDAAGGYLVAWDAPALLERLRKYDLRVPSRVLDLKVLHRLLFPKYRGRRDLNTLAPLLGVRVPPATGLVEEVDLAADCGFAVVDLLEQGAVWERVLDGSSWESIMDDQAEAAEVQWGGLVEWMVSQGRDPETLRKGWPMWE